MYRSPMNRPDREPENEFDLSKLILYAVGFIVVLSLLRGCMYNGQGYRDGYGYNGGAYYGGGGGFGSFVSGMFLGNMLGRSRPSYYIPSNSYSGSGSNYYNSSPSVRGGSWGSGRYSGGGFRFGK